MKELTCIECPNGCFLKIQRDKENNLIVTGNKCPKGETFANNEINNAKRCISTTVKTNFDNLPRISVRTDDKIPIKLIFPCMDLINKVTLNNLVHNGEVILKNILNTGVNVISTTDMYYLMETLCKENSNKS